MKINLNQLPCENATEHAEGATLNDDQGAILEMLTDVGFTITGEQTLPGSEPEYAPVPEKLHIAVRTWLEENYTLGLYKHQVEALGASLDDKDICLATSTSSGKSLVYIASAAHQLLNDPDARVLVLYPAKALIQDQLAKWNATFSPLGLKVGFIDGSVPPAEREAILLGHRAVAMTPDVLHAWFMSHLADKGIAEFRQKLRLLVMDEAHVYDGVFGTNMAFLLRRLRAVSAHHRLICTTATLGDPAAFVRQLTGREVVIFDATAETAHVPRKEIVVARNEHGESFELIADLLRRLAKSYPGRFLAFGDSRKRIELLTAASHRRTQPQDEESAPEETPVSCDFAKGILPYRAGYEAEDRRSIQSALTTGTLRGVVTTSALELGIDIGEIDLVILLDTPPSIKSFRQRLGRAGRRKAGTCIIIDSRQVIGDGNENLKSYLSRPVEVNWLYLENRYAQYTNALCAASEIGQLNGGFEIQCFDSLPKQFRDFLENELHPTVPVAGDLYPLKQAAEGGAHREFPLRNGVEINLRVRTNMEQKLGELSFSQSLREAYPGAVYYYMATPFRVRQFSYRTGEIVVTRERRYTTKPISQVMVFPDLLNGVLNLSTSTTSFVVEAEMQVSERIVGFKEKRGGTETSHQYGPGSPYSQQPLNRFIRTTGVCWYSPHSFAISESLAQLIASAFCNDFGIQPRDIGVGRFHAQQSPLGAGPVNGICIYDNANGSLRLTQRLAENFEAVIKSAITHEKNRGNDLGVSELEILMGLLQQVRPHQAPGEQPQRAAQGVDSEWVQMVAAGERAMFTNANGTQEVRVLGSYFTATGLQYHLEADSPTVRWMVPANSVEPIHGISKMIKLNIMTGEQQS